MNKDIINFEMPVNVKFKFNRKKFAEYMCQCRDLEKESDDYKLVYEVNYEYPNEHLFTNEEVKHMLKNNILIKVEQEDIEAEHLDEFIGVGDFE
jgi:hypothetical protein